MRLPGLCLPILLALLQNAEAAIGPTVTIRLEQNDSSLAPSITAFGTNGELYAAYRAQGPRHQSSALWLRAFDSKTGRELRRSQIKAPVVELPQAPSVFQVSPDGSRLLYAETPAIVGPNRTMYISVIDASSLHLISTTDLAVLGLSNPRIFGFGAESRTITIGSAEEDSDAHHRPLTKSVRLLEMSTSDLGRIVHDQVIANPFEGYGYTVDASGTLWFSKGRPIASALAEYNPKTKALLREIVFGGDYGLSRALFLRDGRILGFTHEASYGATFGRILRFDPEKAEPAHTERITGCGFKQATASPDQLLAVGICDQQSQAELTFGALTVCSAIVLQTGTLHVLATIPLSTRTTWHSVAVWHGNGQVRVATTDESQTVKIYSLAEPLK